MTCKVPSAYNKIGQKRIINEMKQNIGQETLFWSLECIYPCPYHSPPHPPFMHFPSLKRPIKLKAFWLYFTLVISLWFFHPGLICDLVLSQKQKWEKKITAAFFGHFFKNCASVWGVKSRVSIFPEKNFHFGNGMIRKFVA